MSKYVACMPSQGPFNTEQLKTYILVQNAYITIFRARHSLALSVYLVILMYLPSKAGGGTCTCSTIIISPLLIIIDTCTNKYCMHLHELTVILFARVIHCCAYYYWSSSQPGWPRKLVILITSQSLGYYHNGHYFHITFAHTDT